MRDSNRWYYDLLERLLPAEILARSIPLREQLRHKLLSRYRAHGLLGVGGSGDIFGGIGSAKPNPERPEHPGRTALREELVECGELVSVESRACAASASSSPRKSSCWRRRRILHLRSRPPSVRSVLWDRPLLGSLFAFDYVWELFTPPAKRRWGWYVLPMLFGARLVGRIEPRVDRARGEVEVIGLWWEGGFETGRAAGFVDAMRDALRAYLRFGGANRIRWAPHLARERRLFGTPPLGRVSR